MSHWSLDRSTGEAWIGAFGDQLGPPIHQDWPHMNAQKRCGAEKATVGQRFRKLASPCSYEGPKRMVSLLFV